MRQSGNTLNPAAKSHEGAIVFKVRALGTILAISHGASLLRWLAGLDEDRLARS
jgi:hypothetical protein